MRNDKIVPLCERLSSGEKLQDDSNRIIHQKERLEKYARRNYFPNPTHFTNDGTSGTHFDHLVLLP